MHEIMYTVIIILCKDKSQHINEVIDSFSCLYLLFFAFNCEMYRKHIGSFWIASLKRSLALTLTVKRAENGGNSRLILGTLRYVGDQNYRCSNMPCFSMEG